MRKISHELGKCDVNTEDLSAQDPFFYRSTQQMAKMWKGKVEMHYNSGGLILPDHVVLGHCEVPRRRNISPHRPHSHPTPGPPHPHPLPPPGTPGPPGLGAPPLKCQEAVELVCLSDRGKGPTCEACVKKNQFSHIMMAACPPFPFPKVMTWYCD